MSEMLPAPTSPSASLDATRIIFVRGMVVGIAVGAVLGVSLTLALTQPVEEVMRLLRDRLLHEIHEPQFELLN